MGEINLDYLSEIMGGNREALREMIQVMIHEIPQAMTLAQQHHNEKKWGALASEIHKIKPMFTYVGLDDLNQLAQKIEQIGKQESDLTQIPGLLIALQEGIQTMINELRAFLEDQE